MLWAIPVGLGLAGAYMGKKKHEREQQIEDSDRKLAAETARYSPWTGMTPGPIRRAGSEFGSVFGGGLQGGLGGLMFAQGAKELSADTPTETKTDGQSNLTSEVDAKSVADKSKIAAVPPSTGMSNRYSGWLGMQKQYQPWEPEQGS